MLVNEPHVPDPTPALVPALVPTVCSFTPVRSNQNVCRDEVVTEWGFCKKHGRSMQAKRARDKYEQEHAPPRSPTPEPEVVEPVAVSEPTPEVVSVPEPVSDPEEGVSETRSTKRVNLDTELGKIESS